MIDSRFDDIEEEEGSQEGMIEILSPEIEIENNGEIADGNNISKSLSID